MGEELHGEAVTRNEEKNYPKPADGQRHNTGGITFCVNHCLNACFCHGMRHVVTLEKLMSKTITERTPYEIVYVPDRCNVVGESICGSKEPNFGAE